MSINYSATTEENLANFGFIEEEIKVIIDVAEEVGMHPVYLGSNLKGRNASNRREVLEFAANLRLTTRRLIG